MKRSADYHDYVFRNGKIVGEFDQMYRYSKEVPWHQDKIFDKYYGRIGVEIINCAFENANIKTVLDVGCGYGYLFSRIKRHGIKFSGFDIAETAIIKARKLNPDVTLFVDDFINLRHKEKYDLVICREVLWYVIPKLDSALFNLNRLTKTGGYLYIVLSFPKLRTDYIGKKILPNPEALLTILNKDYKGIALNIFQRLNYYKEGPTFHWLGFKK